MAEVTPTRGAALALAEEQRFIEAGYDFLDEKRTLLAQRLLEELEAWRGARRAYDTGAEAARDAMRGALARHGYDRLPGYPTAPGGFDRFALTQDNFLGIELLSASETGWTGPSPLPALDASQAVETCRGAFAALVPLIVQLAVHSRNVTNLIRDYRATERRARALENVILPETVATLAAITEYLDATDQEEALRIRNARR